jgi:hypothetical protein
MMRDLPDGQLIFRGQSYQLVGYRPHICRDGHETQLEVWQSRCAECGEPFECCRPVSAQTLHAVPSLPGAQGTGQSRRKAAASCGVILWNPAKAAGRHHGRQNERPGRYPGRSKGRAQCKPVIAPGRRRQKGRERRHDHRPRKRGRRTLPTLR